MIETANPADTKLTGTDPAGAELIEGAGLEQVGFTNVFELIFQHSYTFAGLLDATGAFLEVNQPALQVVGRSRAEMLGLRLWQLEVWSEAHRHEVKAAVYRAARGQTVHYETEICSRAGRRVVIDFTIRPVPNAAGNTVFLVAEGRDITAERETQARYQALVEALSEGVVQQERGGVISACNGAAERILGLTRDQMMGLSSTDPSWRTVYEDGSSYPGEMHPSMVALQTGEVQRHKIMGVYKPDGTLTWIMIHAQPLLHPGENRPYAVVSSFADITALKETEAKLRHIALHDDLTGLASRTLLTDRLGHALVKANRDSRFQCALLFIDLDGFKAVNDAAGHSAGDALLSDVATRLKLCVREGDTVARLGGDEFVVLLEDLAEPDDAARLAGRILEHLTLSVPHGSAELTVTASIGVVLPEHRATADELLQQADRAMYQAKQLGKARYALFGAIPEATP